MRTEKLYYGFFLGKEEFCVPCPHRKLMHGKIFIGSTTCQKCVHNKGTNRIEQSVQCTFREVKAAELKKRSAELARKIGEPSK